MAPTTMPTDRELAADVARTIAAMFGEVQERLAADMARRLAAGQASPEWAAQKMAAAGDLRRFAERLLAGLDRRLGDAVARALIEAYGHGSVAALDELGRLGERGTAPARSLAELLRRRTGVMAALARARNVLPGAEAILRLAGALTGTLRGTYTPVVRWAMDAYREVITRTALADVLSGVGTRRQASQRAWAQLLGRGITGFTDRSGRNWNLASYVEMATRTGAAQAAVEGHADRLGEAGIDLVVVSNSPQECPRCRPWEGKVLVRNGPAGERTERFEHATRDGVEVMVRIAGSVDEAVRAGLLHPNCTHALSAYLPGLTKAPTATANPEAARARERLRELERRVRRDKLLAAGAIDPAAAARYAERVKATQAQIREHVKASEKYGVFRKPERERPDLGNVV